MNDSKITSETEILSLVKNSSDVQKPGNDESKLPKESKIIPSETKTDVNSVNNLNQTSQGVTVLLSIKTKLENLVQFFRKNNVLSEAIKKISCTNFGTKKGRKLISTRIYSPEASVKNTRKFWFGFRTRMKNFKLKFDIEELKKWHHLSKNMLQTQNP